MPKHHRFALTLSVWLLLTISGYTAIAQSTATSTQPPTITATASSERVRLVSVGEVHQMRLQVFSTTGAQLYDSGYRLGNLLQWQLTDQQGVNLPADTYHYLVSVKDFSGKVWQSHGSAVVEDEQLSLEHVVTADLPEAVNQAWERERQAEVLRPIDRIGAAGRSGSSSEQTGNNGSTAKESVSTATVSAPPPTSNISAGSTGTQNRIAKWLNTNDLGDSGITEDTNGFVGIGITTPGVKLDIVTNPNAYAFRTSDGTVSTGQFNGLGASWMGTFSNHPFHLFTNNGAAQMTLATDGNVGIGTETPNSKLSVNGVVESTSGGVKFPDASIQTTAFTVPLTLSSSSGSQTISATNTGFGRAGFFQINNASNSNPALEVFTNGTGRAGVFQISNSSNVTPALYAQTNGTGSAIHGLTGGTGSAGLFEINNASNSSSALLATTTGTGLAGQFNGGVNVNNARLLVSTDAGGSATVAVGERYRDNALIAWGHVSVSGGVASIPTNQRFGITSAVRDSTGVYTITLNSAPSEFIVPVAVAEVDSAPTSAATARIVTVDRTSTTTFQVYIMNGSFVAVDNDFTFMVTGR